MIAKESYRSFCSKETTIPIFSRSWWLDVVAGPDNWDVALVESGGDIVASMPYVVKNKYGFTLLGQPPLTQTLGPWIKKNESKSASRLAREKDLMQALIQQLPEFSSFSQNWNYNYRNWLPFYWAGFQQTTRYTYALSNLSDLDTIWKGFRDNIRTDCRKSENRFNVKIRSDLGVDEFIRINRKTFSRQGLNVPYSDDFLRTLDKACAQNDARKIFIAEDPEGRHHAGVYIVWDEESAYYLMGGGDPDLRNSGATSLCIWHAIQFASTVTKRFDFEGSMIEPIERFFRSFGAEQIPYFSITKTASRMLRLYQAMRCFR